MLTIGQTYAYGRLTIYLTRIDSPLLYNKGRAQEIRPNLFMKGPGRLNK